jgi:hypothetical protein
VLAHKRHYPSNALVVVHSIDLDRTPDGPVAIGGEVAMFSPWKIDDEHLTAIAYLYRIAAK